jgi:tetratricopeptide (TPR) repeat protein
LLKPLGMLYAYTGRFADARAALARTRSIFAGFGAKFALAESAIPAGAMEMAIGDPAAAERHLRDGHEALRAMGDRRYLADIAGMLAEALYAQGRFDEAQQMTEEAQAALVVTEVNVQPAWWAMQAQLLARRGRFSAARRMMDQAEALLAPVASPWDHGWMLVAKAEVNRLAGAPDVAAADLREALRIYEDRRVPALVMPVRVALASLAVRQDQASP